MKSIGILAGTFDPIHKGHISFANEALKFGLEKVYFLVEPRPRRKQAVKALQHRRAMVKLAIASQPKFGMIQLEQARFNIEKTLPVLKARFKGQKLYLLFGDDIVSHMVDWPFIEELVKSTNLVIATRSYDNDDFKLKLNNFEKTRNMKFSYHIIHPQQTEISSSKIRLDIKGKKKPIGLDPAVARYITNNKLYSDMTGGGPK